MLSSLFGNRNIERILLFLFVNEKCYGTQLQTLLRVPLTPIQNALMRLEKGGIVSSYYEGKVRLYHFNPTFPLRWELESLLKKAYTLLPPQEKKQYCFLHHVKSSGKTQKKELNAFWDRLSKVKELTLEAKSRKGKERKVKKGKAEIIATQNDPSTLTFEEQGFWFVNDHPDIGFSNTFRWSRDLISSLITLEHLRRGADHPVFLFHLSVTQPNKLESVDAHLCGEDTYLGSVAWNTDKIAFHWRIIGPEKNEELVYHYV